MHLVLHNPEIPQNTGNIIRLCQNTGSSLHLIKPLGFNFQDKNLKRAHLDYKEAEKIKIHNSFEDFIRDEKPKNLFCVETNGVSLHTDQKYTESDYFIFGSEGQGLPKIILNHSSIKDVLRIPMIEGNRSLNLSNSVSVVAYEVLRQTKFSSLK